MLASLPTWAQGAPPAGASPLPAESLAAAEQAFARKAWKEAATRSEAIARSAASAPARVAALRLQSKAEVNLNDFPAADRTLRALLALEPEDAVALYLLAYALQRENEPRQSLQMFTRAAALETPTANDLKLVGLDYVLLSDYPDALHWLGRSVAMDPRDTEAWYDLGRAQMHEGQFSSAEASFRRTLAIEPAHVKALDNLGVTLEAQNRLEEALKAYLAAISAQDKAEAGKPGVSGAPRLSEQPLLNYGALLNTRNSFAEAAGVLTRATQIAPANPHCWEEFARAEIGLSRRAEARDAMQRAVALDAKNPRLHYQLGRIYRSLGLVDQAKAEFARSSALYGGESSTPEP